MLRRRPIMETHETPRGRHCLKWQRLHLILHGLQNVFLPPQAFLCARDDSHQCEGAKYRLTFRTNILLTCWIGTGARKPPALCSTLLLLSFLISIWIEIFNYNYLSYCRTPKTFLLPSILIYISVEMKPYVVTLSVGYCQNKQSFGNKLQLLCLFNIFRATKKPTDVKMFDWHIRKYYVVLKDVRSRLNSDGYHSY